MGAQQATNEVAVCNLALGLLQQAPITSIETPVTNAEIICANWYHTVRRLVLAGHIWNFAKKRVVIAKSSVVPAFEYESTYPLPNDYVRFVRLGALPTSNVDHTFENGAILTNGLGATELPIVYIYDFKSVSQMSALFVDLFGYELAIRLSPFLKADQAIVRDLIVQRDRLYKRAAAVDGQEDKPKIVHRSRMLQNRASVGTV